MRGRALLGGSFNPPHIGHLRLAIEIVERCSDCVEQVVFLPCAHPPHKEERTLLPFTLRCTLLEQATSGLPGLAVSRMEGERSERSYTWDTLSFVRSKHPALPLWFVLGSDDYRQLNTWYRGLELPKLTNFLVVPRGRCSLRDFLAATRELWPTASAKGECARLPGGGIARYVDLPMLMISATDIRARFLSGQSLAFLVPDVVAATLRKERVSVARIWGSFDGQCTSTTDS